jgi:hypothetical protein
VKRPKGRGIKPQKGYALNEVNKKYGNTKAKEQYLFESMV